MSKDVSVRVTNNLRFGGGNDPMVRRARAGENKVWLAKEYQLNRDTLYEYLKTEIPNEAFGLQHFEDDEATAQQRINKKCCVVGVVVEPRMTSWIPEMRTR